MIQKLVLFFLLICVISCEEITENDWENEFGDKECIEGKLVYQGSSILLVKMDYGFGESAVETNELTRMEEATESKTHILLSISKAKEEDKNPLMALNEISQYNQIQVEYYLISQEGPAHDKLFNVRLNFGDETYFVKDKSMKAAKISLARKALAATKLPMPAVKSKKISETLDDLTPTVLLNNIAAKLGMKVEYINEQEKQIHKHSLEDKYTGPNYVHMQDVKDSYLKKLNASLQNPDYKKKRLVIPSGDSSPRGPFVVRVNVGDKKFFGEDLTIQGARHKAALAAIEHFKQMSLKDAEECLDKGELCDKLSLKSPISLVYETAKRRDLPVGFEVLGESGPAHKKQFTMLCTVGDLTTKGEGKSKSEAKKKAAEEMLKSMESIGINMIGNDIVVNENKKKKKKKGKKVTRGYINNLQLNVIDALSSVVSTFNGKINDDDVNSNDFDDIKPTKKNELLQLGERGDFNVQFTTTETRGKFLSLVTLNEEPLSYVCLGAHITKVGAEERAAENALRMVGSMDFTNIIVPKNNKEEGGKTTQFDTYTKDKQPIINHDYKI